MPYAPLDLVVTGTAIASAWGNQIRANFAASAPGVVTTAGDLVYGTGANALARLGVGTAGQVLRVNSGATAPQWFSPPSCRLKTSSNLAITTGTYYIPWNQEDHDNDSMHDTATNNTRITINTPGVYSIWANFSIETFQNFACYAYAWVNRTNVPFAARYDGDTVHVEQQINIRFEYKLALNDYVEFRIDQSSGVNKNMTQLGGGTTNGSPCCGATWISPG